MLRKLMIRFTGDGDYFREIDEERNYFLIEAEEIVEKIRNRLVKEKRVAAPKPFEFWINGKLAVISHVNFERKESLQKQLEQTILTFDSWDEGIRYKYVNLLKEYAEEERQLFLNREFHAFAVRYDQMFGNPAYEPFPLILDITHLNQLYGAVQKHVTTGFYSELEKIMESIQTAFNKLAIDAYEKESVNQQEGFQKKKEMTEKEVIATIRDEAGFQRIIQYLVACYQSVTKSRIEALCPHFRPYQELQDVLFKKVTKVRKFSDAYNVHVLMNKEIEEKFDSIMYQGFALGTDEMVESLVLSPVVQKYKGIVKGLLEGGVLVGDGSK
ncbi:hypothetical protein H7992_04995 [Sporosarcina sp. resist]|uniref:hypothetical protein n=1 Tax=Sporosarcina sp. resist TaxID=2762563 RepID=UPI00164DD723|nr:hypothetical protein [Sporosarcina sp. resist]QNK89085.1 hypothetical protein H7992_04995 [Sporosarcina sp. resist]